jgi:AcrR family transcriptional regulator
MPAIAKTGPDEIVDAARALLEQHGLDGLTMMAVAERVGVRAPSLYKRVGDRRALLELVVHATAEDLAGRAEAARHRDPVDTIRAQADGLRAFAHEQPAAFGLLFGVHGAPTPDPADTARTVQPLLEATTELVGDAHALDAARLVVAWANGFITMELAGAFRLGDDVERAWVWGRDRIVASLG